MDSRKMLYASGDPAEAEAIRHHLEARGVAAVVEPVPAQDRTGGCTSPGNVYEINLVCEEDLSRGREALLEFFEQALRPVLSEVEQPSPRLDRSLLAEVTIVGLVGWLASVYGAVAFYVWPEAPEEHFWHSTTLDLVWDLPIIAVVLLLVFKNRESFSSVGLVRPRLVRDALSAGGVWLADFGLFLVFSFWVFPFIQPFLPKPSVDPYKFFVLPSNAAEFSFLMVTIIVSAFYQELLMRGYMISRLERLLDSPGSAIAITTILFALAHIYQGVYGVAESALSGMVYGVAFSLTGRLWPVFLAHAGHNIYWVVARMLR